MTLQEAIQRIHELDMQIVDLERAMTVCHSWWKKNSVLDEEPMEKAFKNSEEFRGIDSMRTALRQERNGFIIKYAPPLDLYILKNFNFTAVIAAARKEAGIVRDKSAADLMAIAACLELDQEKLKEWHERLFK